MKCKKINAKKLLLFDIISFVLWMRIREQMMKKHMIINILKWSE